MKMKHGTDQEFEVLVVPQICKPISLQLLSVCVTSCEHLSQLQLADPGSNVPLEVDVLIGNDYYWRDKVWYYWPSSHKDQIGMGAVWPRPINSHGDTSCKPHHHSQSNNKNGIFE